MVGVVGALAGVVGSMMALEAVKLIVGAGEPLTGRLWLYDALDGESRTVRLPPDPDCPACGGR
jgi:bacteriocin biosynthesis cyclodehydratase domain-containing protein